MTSVVDWTLNQWNASLTFRYVDSMVQASGNTLDSRLFTDLRLRYTVPFYSNDMSLTLGMNNIFDEGAPAQSAGQFRIGTAALNMYDLRGRRLFFNVTTRW